MVAPEKSDATPSEPKASRGVIAIIGGPQEPEVAAVEAALKARAADVFIFDASKFPESPELTLTQDTIRIDGKPFPKWTAVYVRQLYLSPIGFRVDVVEAMKENWEATLRTFREKGELLNAFLVRLEEGGVRMVNPPSSGRWNIKPVQLRRLKAAGIAVPDTIATNSPTEVRAFAKKHDQIIYKPVGGGATTQPLDEKDLTDERMELLRNAPVTFQEFVPGQNVRVYVVGGKVAASAIIETTDDFDFRRAEGRAENIDVPPQVGGWCLKAAEVCGLAFTAIDLKRHAGRWVMLEANTSPMFAGFDAKSGNNVAGALAEFLAN